ncbi:MAG: hypothetical protein AAF399_22520 [Bacteroidota bacterium]
MNPRSLNESDDDGKELSGFDHLKNVPKAPFFSAPDGYFDRLSSKLEERLEVETELQADAPTLSQLERTPFFAAPEGYFAQFSTRIMALITESEQPTASRVVRPLWKRPAFSLSLAAGIALLALVWVGRGAETVPSLDSVSTDELIVMIEEEAIPTEMLLEYLGEESWELDQELAVPSFEEEELASYLEDLDQTELEAVLMDL